MRERTRRDLLAGVAAGTASLAGCAGRPGNGAADTGTPTLTPAEVPTDTPSPTPGPDTLRFTEVDGVVDGATVVYPELLRGWLLQAAASEEPVRVTATTPFPTPEPVMTRFDSVVLESGDESVDGAYTVDCEGGTRYELLVGARSVEDVPENVTVTSLSSLSGRRREFALAAIGDERATVYPETPLGAWVRGEWFDGHFEYDGTVYRGTEIHQTDAAFFSEEFWMSLSLSPTADSNVGGPRLSLADLGPDVRRSVDEALADWERNDEEAMYTTHELPESVRSFAERTDHLLTHTTAFEVAAIDLIG
jgi:hypothetical protein